MQQFRRFASSPGTAVESLEDRGYPVPPPLRSVRTAEEHAQVEAWLKRFKNMAIPKTFVEAKFTKSSGPGGQNVNKVNTKATIRVKLDSAIIPQWLVIYLRRSPHYVKSDDSLLLHNEVHRSQAHNLKACLRKLHGILLSSAEKFVVREPSEEQKEHVRNLEKIEDVRRKQQKSRRSEIKRSRSTRDWD
ncbi:hypothetical protein OBBRIDRAFT_721982 [Obba rivulosa]|uniref:Prokaryotic-type class I peptide chain release factors domain-containing protein n=1 Tax=Obba rivulosa TaxID=1052685 RepID=A0A8E2DS59_9APHY|nr:hypothetical protein OBBRIDRAFT_721982 [Obba rivulosa]